MEKTGGQILVESLKALGADTVFCVPGESYLAALDALYDAPEIRVVTCRHEAAATNMAEAYGKLTGNPGICFVTRGPGATHASIGVHTAFQDSTPLILFIGQVAREDKGREAFQEVDYEIMFKALAKHVVEVDAADKMAEAVVGAWEAAMSGRKGPAILSLPEDMLVEKAEYTGTRDASIETAIATKEDVDAALKLLSEAQRPFVILGGTGWTEAGIHAMETWAEQNAMPITCAFRFQHLFHHDHPNYVGDVGIGINPALADAVRKADVILALGPRLGEMTTSGYSLIKPPKPDQTLIHVHAGKEELGRVYDAHLKIHSNPDTFAKALLDKTLGTEGQLADYLHSMRQSYENWAKPEPNAGDVQLGQIYAWLNRHVAKDTIIANGAGNNTVWLHRHYRYGGLGTQLAPTSGAMGYGLPAAIAAKIRYPDRTVISVTGDGCFMMAVTDLVTAVKEKAAVIFLVFNNAMYGTIRMHQEKFYPDRVIATDLLNPDFPALARACGLKAWQVKTNEEFEAAFEKAEKEGGPTLIEVIVDPEAITPRATLSQIKGTG